MTNRRNAEGLTTAAAKALAITSPRFGQWGVEKRLRDQLALEDLVTVEQHGRETKIHLTERGKLYRKVYRRAGLHKTEWSKLTDEQRREWLEATASIAGATGAIIALCS